MWGFRARLTRGNLLCEINKREGGGGGLLCEGDEGGGCVCAVREACDFRKWFMKNLGVNHFPKFCIAFFGQHKSFAVD